MVRRSITAFRAFVIGCIAISSVIVAAQNPGGSPEARKVRNPVPPTAASIKTGGLLYHKNCEFCHGPKGLVTAAWSRGLHPANLTTRIGCAADLGESRRLANVRVPSQDEGGQAG